MLKSYQKAVDFLESRRKFGIKPGFERLDYLLSKTDHPEKKMKAVHIAGTNGKGSTLTFLKEVLVLEGYSIGSFVSPGLPTVKDHIKINHEEISEASFTAIINKLLPIIKEMDDQAMEPSEYEILMVIAWIYFQKQVDLVLIEACMGGKEDVTNRIDPLLTIITSVSYDHTAFLGSSIEEIASHKAGIIKQNIPVVTGILPDHASLVVKNKAEDENARVYSWQRDFSISHYNTDKNQQTFQFNHDHLNLMVTIRMQGMHQVENAAVAMMALELLMTKGIVTSYTNIKKGFSTAFIANRLEKISESPAVFIDGAHNTAAVQKLAAFMKEQFPHKKIYTLFSAFKDKDIDQMLEDIVEFSNQVIVTTFDHPRALHGNELNNGLSFIDRPFEALDHLLRRLDKDDILLITGSLHFVEMMKQYVKHNNILKAASTPKQNEVSGS